MTDSEIQRRQAVNAARRKAERERLGKCRCGKKAAANAKSCPACATKARRASRAAYRRKHGIPLDAPVAKIGRKRKITTPARVGEKPRTSFTRGVTRSVNRDGYGREAVWYVATCMVNGKSRARKWSASKYGEAGAKMLAALHKLAWLIELGVWKPEDGDPLALLGYTDTFEGNRDYADCQLEPELSPWIQRYESDENLA